MNVLYVNVQVQGVHKIVLNIDNNIQSCHNITLVCVPPKTHKPKVPKQRQSHEITKDEKIKYDKAKYIIIILKVVTVSLIFFLCSNLHYDVQRL